MRTTAIMNLKGGTGKTVSTINLAAILSKLHGADVLLIDADSQGNLSEFTALRPADLKDAKGTASLLTSKEFTVMPTKMDRVVLIPGDTELMALDVSSARSGIADPMALADILEKFDRARAYDYCLIDCPPAFSAAAMAALAAADEVVIPVKLDAFGIRGLAKLVAQISNMQKVNPDLEIAGVLPTMFYPTPAQRAAEEDLRTCLTAMGVRCFQHIRRSPSVDASTFAQSPLVYYSPKSGACRDYKIFVRDLTGEGADADGV